MSDSTNDEKSHAHPGVDAKMPILSFPAAEGSAEGIVVVLHMRPDRIGGGHTAAPSAEPAEGVTKSYRTTSWYFASDFLDRVAEVSRRECAGFRVRPVQVDVTFALDEKAYRHVSLVLESFDTAYRGL